MRVLIIEASEGSADIATSLLEAEGHTTVACHTPSMGEPCAALEPGMACPIESGPVDVALLTGQERRPAPRHRPGLRVRPPVEPPDRVAG